MFPLEYSLGTLLKRVNICSIKKKYIDYVLILISPTFTTNEEIQSRRVVKFLISNNSVL